MDRLDAMQVLLAVVDAGSLSAASRKLNVSLPSISRKVADLERHLGTRLLIRTTRNIQLTDAGCDYVEEARAIISRLHEAESRASGEYDRPRGNLSITMPLEFGRIVGIPILAEFLDEYPEITASVIATDRAVQLLDEQVDVAIRVGNLADSSFHATKVGEIVLMTVASPRYLSRNGEPKHPAELLHHDAIIFGPIEQVWVNYSSEGERFDIHPRQRARVNTGNSAVAAAVCGIGLTRALNFQVAEHLVSGALIAVLGDYSSRTLPVHLVYAKQGLMPLKVRAFLDFAGPRLRQKLQSFHDLSQRSTATRTVADKLGRSVHTSA